jgi:D-alanyl-D-alanine carboxypeptidase/D-alanyl-D-alanine-endopeptidase (penicillin-binding protein 4)
VARRRALAGALALAALVCGAIAVRSGTPPDARAATTMRAVTPLVSVRRVPEIVRDDVAAARLGQDLQQATTGQAVCLTVDGPAGRLVSTNADLPLAPASTLKVLTAWATLATFGPDYTFRTTAVSAGPPREGMVDRLWLVGSGDPVLSTPEQSAALGRDPLRRGDVTTSLAVLADAIVGAGVRAIPGGIAGDDHLFEASRSLPSWPSRFVANGEIGPLGALTVDDGFVAPLGARAEDPALNAASELATMLQARGVQVGPSGHATAPASARVIGSVSSRPLRDVVASMLSSSDNLTAELLLRLLGTRVATPGTTEAGIRVVLDALRGLGVETASLNVLDGSGLSPADRMTCSALLAVLEQSGAARTRAVLDGLSVAGERGTLATRLRGTPLAGRLRAKTGSLTGVTGLVGIVDVRTPLRFAYIANGAFDENAGMVMRERVATVLATYPDATLDAGLVPAPAPPSPAPARA